MIRFADAGESGDKKEKDVFCGLCLQKTSFLYGYKVIKEKISKKQCEISADKILKLSIFNDKIY